ncbi:class I SAM-dependent methyltransferase [Candidatus Halobonum tyrrellensis]|uniref:Methyltransferase type 11 n=1 Tax=Candidatus Halobonum tyrrellensis G22 TaxID=1324957 RepID=V4J200_9EURY|nr:class I SAM-dependent methyltransferase [Candidatus Halobonum tyrrellensis]ESP89447.1 methyltransferase type 11 [Candidatus Halobonum tyrrellensis G22]
MDLDADADGDEEGDGSTTDVPRTVTAALADRPVEGRVCLEAGAGIGNTSAGLLAAGADRVYAVTNDRGHAETVRDRVGPAAAGDARANAAGGRAADDRLAVVEADLRSVPLDADAVGLVTAHGLFNVVPPASLDRIAAELTRVAAPGAHLVVDDYDPLPDDAAVRDLFAVENAATELATGSPALTFYPAAVLARLFAGYGWTVDRERTLLDPVPWTGRHVSAHAAKARGAASSLRPELGDPLAAEADRLAAAVGEESAGRMYSVALRLPEEHG